MNRLQLALVISNLQRTGQKVRVSSCSKKCMSAAQNVEIAKRSDVIYPTNTRQCQTLLRKKANSFGHSCFLKS